MVCLVSLASYARAQLPHRLVLCSRSLLRLPGNHVGAPPQVYANDLNPRSYHWLVKNIALNKVSRYLHTLPLRSLHV